MDCASLKIDYFLRNMCTEYEFWMCFIWYFLLLKKPSLLRFFISLLNILLNVTFYFEVNLKLIKKIKIYRNNIF